mmetsp:Transcript_27793/g.46509  ORF Transcript_27793/g.46509 Transcript_27793/m.46509 type:complete len:326 (+) Transcript_27793:65-1042(+)|eukprot:CAMPEP_0198211008 /NCGR_PEP_ID=MMETSP1445-20131203/22567_1 /TAXON_ID=36898 /ORGANISM="Pyramimonas sp., Strain CCMP2087" /LENGTH=325 /DNA_ID=CAMNT_0043885187 /DNA_START=37 /DNA_END=1014 /DNA_ORIENTATION=-
MNTKFRECLYICTILVLLTSFLFYPKQNLLCSQVGTNVEGHSQPVAVFSMLADFNVLQQGEFTRIEYPFLALHDHSASHRVIVDIGLKDGQETLAAVTSGYVVYAFEPIPLYCAQVRKALKLRGLEYFDVKLHPDGAMFDISLPLPKEGHGICYLFCVAAGANHDWKTIYLHEFGTSFHDETARQLGNSIEVQVVPISDYVKVDVFFMKIDSQGHEVDVMRGALDLYNNYVVRMVGMEFWPKGLNMAGQSPKTLLDILARELKLTCFDLDLSSPLHPEEFTEYEKHIQLRQEAVQERKRRKKSKNTWGWFVELVCVNTNKLYKSV